MVNERTTSEHTQQDGQARLTFHATPTECVESDHNSIAGEYQVVDHDNMTCEEPVELGEIGVINHTADFVSSSF